MTKNKKILLSLPTAIAARNFFQSGVVDALVSESRFDLIVVCPPLTQKIYANSDSRVTFRSDMHRQNHWVLRILLFLQRRRFYYVKPTASSEIIKIAPLFRSFGHRFGPMVTFPFSNSAKVLKALESLSSKLGRYIYRDLAVELDQENFDLVIVTHPTDSKEFPIKVAAKACSLKVVGCIKSFDNLTTKGYIFPLDNHYIVWNRMMVDELKYLYDFPRSETSIIGVLQFDPYFRKKAKALNKTLSSIESCKFRILYAASPPMITPDDPEIVRALVNKLSPKKFEICVRVHQMDDYRRWENLEGVEIIGLDQDLGRSTFQRIADTNHVSGLTENLCWSDVVVVTCSTMMLDATCFSKPVINIGFNYPCIRQKSLDVKRFYAFDHYKEIVSSPLFQLALSIEELERMIIELAHKSSTCEKETALLLDSYVPYRDGRTVDRFVASITKIVDSE
ncbi:hypothetical protein N9X65_06210 [Porticoccaceae bacterium]|nr:hypothetical protein [Porticoccaceae bacterium]